MTATDSTTGSPAQTDGTVAPHTEQPREAFFEQTWDLSYRHALGETLGGFFDGLRNKQLLGRRCPSCQRVLVPARSACDQCHVATTDWVEVGPAGAVTVSTVVSMPVKGMTEPGPYLLAYVHVQGGDTAVAGHVRGIALEDPAAAAQQLPPGAQVVVRFTDQPQGRVTDFWFEPA